MKKGPTDKRLGDLIAERKAKRNQRRIERIEEIENLLLEMPFDDKKFMTLSDERNNLLAVVTY